MRFQDQTHIQDYLIPKFSLGINEIQTLCIVLVEIKGTSCPKFKRELYRDDDGLHVDQCRQARHHLLLRMLFGCMRTTTID